jgi:acetyltransferase
VRDLGQLFHAARALASGFHPRGSRLAILSNGTGPARMAADSARRLGIPLPALAPATVTTLKPLLPREWKGHNPIDLGGDASSERYLEASRQLALDEQIDAILVVLSPLALVSPTAVAEGLVDIARNSRTTLCCCFMGGAQVAGARQILEEAGIPVFRTPDTVIELFHNISTYYQNQKLLLQVPSPGRQAAGAAGSGRVLVDALIAERRRVLSRMEAHALLHTYGVPVRPSMVAHRHRGDVRRRADRPAGRCASRIPRPGRCLRRTGRAPQADQHRIGAHGAARPGRGPPAGRPGAAHPRRDHRAAW